MQSWNLLSDEEKSANVITSLFQDGQLQQLVDDNSETIEWIDRTCSKRESRSGLIQDRTFNIDSKNGSIEVVNPETGV